MDYACKNTKKEANLQKDSLLFLELLLRLELSSLRSLFCFSDAATSSAHFISPPVSFHGGRFSRKNLPVRKFICIFAAETNFLKRCVSIVYQLTTL